MDTFNFSTWQEDLLFIASFLMMITGFILMCYGFGVTILALLGKYCAKAIIVHWTSVANAILIASCGETFNAFLYYAWSSPFILIAMSMMERNRILKLESAQTSSEHVNHQ